MNSESFFVEKLLEKQFQHPRNCRNNTQQRENSFSLFSELNFLFIQGYKGPICMQKRIFFSCIDLESFFIVLQARSIWSLVFMKNPFSVSSTMLSPEQHHLNFFKTKCSYIKQICKMYNL